MCSLQSFIISFFLFFSYDSYTYWFGCTCMHLCQLRCRRCSARLINRVNPFCESSWVEPTVEPLSSEVCRNREPRRWGLWESLAPAPARFVPRSYKVIRRRAERTESGLRDIACGAASDGWRNIEGYVAESRQGAGRRGATTESREGRWRAGNAGNHRERSSPFVPFFLLPR